MDGPVNEDQLLELTGVRIYVQPKLSLRRVVLLTTDDDQLVGIVVAHPVVAEGIAKNDLAGLDVCQIRKSVFNQAYRSFGLTLPPPPAEAPRCRPTPERSAGS